MEMQMEDNQQNNMLSEKQPTSAKSPKPIVRIVLSLVILVVGIGAASYLKNSAPRTRKRPPAKLSPTVLIQTVKPSGYQIIVTAMGTVIPAQEVVLKSRVSGEIIEIHPEFTEGGLLKKDMKIIQVDPQDYELALAQKRSAVTDAEYALKLELGHQEVAKREWELLNQGKPAQDMEKELALRQPHLDKARADLSAAEAELQAAMLDLERTQIIVPFNAMVRSKSVDLGSQVTPQDSLAELVGTDAYRVQVSLPVDRLEWIDVPVKAGAPGSKARINYGKGHECSGRVTRLMGDLATEGRMARILVEVADPLGLKTSNKDRAPLLIGEYVRVKILGRKLDGVFQIPRTALRDNSSVWIVKENKILEIRKVQPVWRDADVVLLKDDLKSGEHLIVSDLAAPVEGMTVRVDTSKSEIKNHEVVKEKAAKGENS
jgi:RND family efflux transporter MFP subunit